MKLKPGLGASYTIRPGNGVGQFQCPGATRGLKFHEENDYFHHKGGPIFRQFYVKNESIAHSNHYIMHMTVTASY